MGTFTQKKQLFLTVFNTKGNIKWYTEKKELQMEAPFFFLPNTLMIRIIYFYLREQMPLVDSAEELSESNSRRGVDI